LQDVLVDYELSLNPRKTVIRECPWPLNASWHIDLSAFPLPDRGNASRQVLLSFIDRAFQLTQQNRDEPVLNWVISRLMSLTYSQSQWNIVEPLVLQAAVSEPGALPRCLRFLHRAQQIGLAVNLNAITRALEVAMTNAVRRGHGSEASWAVWGHILFNLPLDNTLVAAISTMDDDTVALVTLDAQARGLIPAATLFPKWAAHLTINGMRDGHWLLAYEAIAKQWLTPPGSNPVTANPAYNHLAASAVTFYELGDPAALTNAHRASAPSWMVPPQQYIP
jgi:hypothetical protein